MFQVVLASAMNLDRLTQRHGQRVPARIAHGARERQRLLRGAQCPPRVRCRLPHELIGRAGPDHAAALVTAFGT